MMLGIVIPLITDKFHSLTGNRKGSYSVTVTGNWRITFKFDSENAVDVNYEDYH